MTTPRLTKVVFGFFLIASALGVSACSDVGTTVEKIQHEINKDVLNTPNYNNREPHMTSGPNTAIQKLPTYQRQP